MRFILSHWIGVARTFPPFSIRSSIVFCWFTTLRFQVSLTWKLIWISGLSGWVTVGHDLHIIILELLSDSDEGLIVFIENITVSNYFIDVCVELSGSFIFIVFEIILDCLDVHRLLYNLMVIWDTQGYGIDRLSEMKWCSTVL